MSRRILRPRTDVCQLCDFIVTRQSPLIHSYPPRKTFSPRAFSTTKRAPTQKSPISNSSAVTAAVIRQAPRQSHAPKRNYAARHVSQDELEKMLIEARGACDKLLSLERVPKEQETVSALTQCNLLAQLLVLDAPSPSLNHKDGASSALLSLDDSSNPKKIPLRELPQSIQRMIDELSSMAYSIVKHGPIFITPQVLEIYTTIQCNLAKPETFPEVFFLYANKPLPQEGSSPIRYTKQNPNKVANAVPISTANRALQAAIDSKQLVVAMEIIESTYITKAFHRAKFVRKGLLPATGLAVAPVAAYTVASKLAVLQTTMDSGMATNVAFAGILAYLGFTATIGVVAVTTANDQMDRVTWAQGMPLRERWIREEERAAIDQVAVSWGFRELWRRGEEEGKDWDALREWIGRKGMILDRVELMEGME